MALWQFSVRFLPEQSVIACFGTIPTRIDWDEYNRISDSLDVLSVPQHEIEGYIGNLLAEKCGIERTTSWSSSITAWGNEHEHDVQLRCYEKGKISLVAQLDVRSLRRDFMECVIEIGRTFECVLYTKNQAVIQPEMELLKEEIRNSRAYAFCADPHGFLSGLGKSS